MALTFYKAVRLIRCKVWQLAVPDGLRVAEPDEQLVGEPATPFEVVAEERVGPSLEALAAQLRLRVGQRVRRAELDARFEAVEELAAWPVEGLSVQPVADSGVRSAATRLVPEGVR